MNVLIMVLGTIGSRIHENVKSIEGNDKHYFITEADGSRITLSKDKYMLIII